ncbi:MAG: hypothetical protein JJT95_13310 [Pararhodobacter sp.]|nr:hypothetical protein [Pararhodobacter sp.]
MRMPGAFILCLLLAGCARPLAPGEAELAQRLFGDTLDPARVRLIDNGLIGITTREIPVRPRTTCRERIVPPAEGETFTARTAGMVLGNIIHLRPAIYRGDYAARENGVANLVAVMFIAHELTHVWQWQNRALTGYTPLRAAMEHAGSVDPYLFDPATEARFLDYGYEQQAVLVEEYICCTVLDPEGARTQRLRETLSEVMPVQDRVLERPVSIPRPDGAPAGICS